ncbi:MAG TPA: RNA-binding cell elongation regulator Jag/EloR [Dehalococcoidales bacterium]|nr:RNA-binding cell elongation regulator Jag/EloR [Dehalococcoidales bacterium]
MERLEITARTVEEAIKKASAALNLTEDRLKIEVVSEGRSGVLGIGASDARILASAVDFESIGANNEQVEEARQYVQELLNKLGLKGTIEVNMPEEELDEEGEVNPVVFNLTGPEMSGLIGRRGQTLDSFQYILRLILSRKTRSRIPVIIDVDNYKKRRLEELRAMALNVAEQVKARKNTIRLEPMPAYERRIIHTTLANDTEVVTESTGEGESRKVVVFPRNKK